MTDADYRLAEMFNHTKVAMDPLGYDSPVTYLIQHQYLADPRFIPIAFESDATIDEPLPGTDYSNSDLAGLGRDGDRTRQIVELAMRAVKRHPRTIVFCPSVDSAIECNRLLLHEGVASAVLTGRTDKDDRRAIVDAFKHGTNEHMVLFNYGVLTAGFDAPRTRCVIIARPTTSLVLYSQMAGRAMRGCRSGGNRRAEIFTVVDTTLPGFGSVTEAFSNWGGTMVDQLAYRLKDVDRSLFPGSFTIRALRDSRYHNSAYAIAELIDNSIEAEADEVELLCMKRAALVRERAREQVTGIAVLDNGNGMELEELVHALKFGGGTHHNSRRGIGKYGMGLPTSSMSQCKTVDVWTWQDGIESALHSRIDADAIEAGEHDVPIPDQRTPIPEPLRVAGSADIFQDRSGTLVVWSNLDKLQWRTAKALLDNTSRELGRMHRHLIKSGLTTVRTAEFLENRPASVERHVIDANDPLYLMSRTTVPEAPWDHEAMFKEWKEPQHIPLVVDGRTEDIVIRYSIVKPEALQTDRVTQNPGDTPRGKHARRNMGVSVVREAREIALEGAFMREGGSARNPQNRWWGCEIEFHRHCDELFGIDHNKQVVSNFSQAARTLAGDDRRHQAILDEMGLDDDPIHQIVAGIRDEIRAMMREISRMFNQRQPVEPPRGTTRRNPASKAAKTATDADKDAIDAGIETPTETDQDRENIPPDVREEALTDQFIKLGQAAEDARVLAHRLIEEGLAYQFNHDQLDGFQMFNVRRNQGILHINLNTDHPIYRLLEHIEHDLDENVDESDPAYQASVAIRLLLSSWARMEDQTDSQDERMRIQDIAMTWGRQVDKVVRYLRERDE